MNRKISITSCVTCPYKDHGGGFGQVSYIPVCRLKDRKRLPYTENASGGLVIAQATGEIPDWCPLEVDVSPVAAPGCDHPESEGMKDHVKCLKCGMVQPHTLEYDHAGGKWFTNMDDARAYENRWGPLGLETKP
jgi:hypothetical protein